MKTLLAAILLTASLALGQNGPAFGKAPSVTMAPVTPVTVSQGGSAPLQFDFRVAEPFHINSHQPKDEFLLPTVLKLNAPNDVAIGRLSYPAGEERSFPFAPDQKLSVYSGDFAVRGLLTTTRTIAPGKYRVHGTLTYQACDNAACYPPKRLPVAFDIRVLKPQPPRSGNPGQSPHVH